jgi:hypothetical protein
VNAGDDGTLAIEAEHSVPLATVSFSGNRYVAMADVGLPGPVPLMVHGNGRVYLSLVHAVAERLAGGPVSKLEDYGYTTRGKGSIDVPTLRLGDAAFDAVASAPVFDFSDAPDDPVQGMLGTRFLTAARAAVDFTSDSLLLGVRLDAAPNPGLIRRGYRHVPMQVADDGRVTIQAYFPAIDRTLSITPSTVANALTLHALLFAGMIDMVPSTTDQSPSGTSPEVFTSDGVAFQIAGVDCRADASLQDLAEYGKVHESALGSYGMLGFDWMKEHEAVIDYANLVLYFRP